MKCPFCGTTLVPPGTQMRDVEDPDAIKDHLRWCRKHKKRLKQSSNPKPGKG